MTNIRMASQWDSPQLVAWWKAMIDEKQLPGMVADMHETTKALSGFNDALKNNGKNIYCIIAEVDGAPAGFMHSFIEQPFWGFTGISGNIAFCYIGKKFRHLHIARDLGLSTEKFFIRSGCKFGIMSVKVDSGDAEAHTRLHGMTPTYTILRKDF